MINSKSPSRYYNIDYNTISIIFICNALGFIAAAFFINTLSTKIGRAKTIVIGQVLLMLGYTCIVITPPFPAVAASSVLPFSPFANYAAHSCEF